ncbi:MAG: carboxypeptidase-like regulatory domain-containing protein, partial [Bacteroidales bacterium]|nr:carboxypeptidase-like regulatory domain-containing protein [Bacteroidales bacterium]
LSFQIWDGEKYATLDAIRTSEISLKMRFAYREKYLMGAFDRINIGTKYPIMELNMTYGVPGLFASKDEYFRMSYQIKQWFNVGGLGWSKYIVETGKLWGTVPYPLLEIAPGNQTLISDEYAYNLMNYYEFINDEYVSIFYTHHFDGLFFNHIPLLRKLNWREVIHAKGIIGNISDQNAQFSIFPSYSYSLSKPYYEMGVGIENIFKIIRIDFIWRLNHHEHPGTQHFGIFGALYFSF